MNEYTKQQKLEKPQFNIKNNDKVHTRKRKSSFFDHLGISPTLSPHSPKNPRRNSKNIKPFSINEIGENIPSESKKKKSEKEDITTKTKRNNETPKIKTSKIITEKSTSLYETKMGYQPFQSPLIRTSKFLKMPVSNLADLLASNFSDYLNSVKEKNQIMYSEFIGNQKSMKNFLLNVLFHFKTLN